MQIRAIGNSPSTNVRLANFTLKPRFEIFRRSKFEKNTHGKGCTCEEFCSKTSLGGELQERDVIMHKSHYTAVTTPEIYASNYPEFA